MQQFRRILKKHFKHLSVAVAVAVLLLLAGLTSLYPQAVQAAGDAYFTLTPSSGSFTVGNTFTLNVYETSTAGDNVEGVQANLSYNASLLDCTSVSVSGTDFTYLGQDTCGGGSVKIGEASGATVSSQQFVGSISFKVVAAGNTNVGITSGSDIQDSSTNSVWNGVDTSASYNFSNPPTSSGGSSGSTTSSGSKTSSPSSSSTTPTTSAVTKPTSSTTKPKTNTSPQPTNTVPTTYATLTITVVDSHDKPVKDAKVTLDNKASAYTNAQGTVFFSGLSGGTYTVTVTAPGEKPTTTTVILASGQNKDVALKIARKASFLPFILFSTAGLVIVVGGIFTWLHLTGRILRLPFVNTHSSGMAAGSMGSVVVGNGIARPVPIVPTQHPPAKPPTPPIGQSRIDRT